MDLIQNLDEHKGITNILFEVTLCYIILTQVNMSYEYIHSTSSVYRDYVASVVFV